MSGDDVSDVVARLAYEFREAYSYPFSARTWNNIHLDVMCQIGYEPQRDGTTYHATDYWTVPVEEIRVSGALLQGVAFIGLSPGTNTIDALGIDMNVIETFPNIDMILALPDKF